MRHDFPPFQSPRMGSGAAVGIIGPAFWTGLPQAAEAQLFTLTRTIMRRAGASLLSLYERAPWPEAAARAWSFLNDNAHVDRRAPPGRDKGGGRQGEPDRGI